MFFLKMLKIEPSIEPSNQVFRSLSVEKYISYEDDLFFEKKKAFLTSIVFTLINKYGIGAFLQV